MSDEMVALAKKYISNLSAKGVLYIEAVEMIARGHKLIEEGEKMLHHLEGRKPKNHAGYGGTQGGKLLTEALSSEPNQVLKRMYKALAKTQMSSKELALAAGCSDTYVRKVLESDNGVVRVGTGNQVKWAIAGTVPAQKKARKTKKTVANKTARKKAKRTRTGALQAKCKPADPEQDKKDQDKVVSLLKETPGLSIGALMKKTKRSFYPLQRAIKVCVKDGRLTPVKTETDNGRKVATWTPA
jgi:hypothetical protein